MMKRALLALVLLLGPVSQAAAQQQAESVCGWEFGKWVCRSKAAPSSSIARHKFPDTGERFRRSYEAAQAMRADREQSEADMVRRQVGRLVANGDCDSARQVALSAGELDLAEQTARLCTSPD